MKHILSVLFIFICLACPGYGVAKELTKADADSAFAKEHYAEAVQIYSALIDSLGESAMLYFNLGNCYYRQDSVARAILNYERALLLDPSDDDVRFNLDMARAKTVDKVVPNSEMFFVSVFHSLVLSLSINQWSAIAIVSFVLALIAALVYFFAPTITAKKIGFTATVVGLIVCIFANISGFQQRSRMRNRNSAIVMSPSAVVKSTPNASGTDLFILHDGTHVEITDDSMNEWVEIKVSEGKEGWMARTDLEII